jgi:hypothetical protein
MPQPTNKLAPAPVNALATYATAPQDRPPPPYAAITDLAKYAKLTSDNPNIKINYQPLNFDALLNAGAFRVTHRGLDEGYDPDPKAGFSLVSAYNDAVGPQTRSWKDNPYALPVVREIMTQRPGDIGAHKYQQIVQSARDMGLTDEQIFGKQ